MAELEAVYKRDPGQIQAGAVLANLYIASGQATRAVQVADALFKRRPGDAQLANLVGSARAAKGDVPAARAAFEQALMLDPAFTEPMLNLARIEIDFKEFEPAQRRLTALLAKDEKNTDFAIEMARLSSASGDAEEALRWLQRADDNSGQRLGPTLQLVDFHLARGRPDLARTAVARLQGKAPEALAVLLATARVQLANKEFAEARTVLTRATTVASYDAAALTQIGDLQARAGNPTGAAHALDKALSEKPDHLRARVLRSNVYLLQGDPVKAEAMARGVVASHPKSGLGHALLGDVAMYRKQLPAAVEAYRRAHAVEQSTQSLVRLFGALESVQRPAAMSLANDWLRSKPDDAGVWRALGDAEARAGNLAGARTAYERAARQTPTMPTR
ncbi:MAG: tetratricopeptide repeat protein [Betaproteobacteria bacterium]|nr:tetratricopeptide repeat protein [Betaproteobacteria bacterium]